MGKDKWLNILLALTFSGLLFSGYMSSVKFFTQTCVFNEPCPYFLGLPACYYGFGMFLALTVLSSLLFFKKIPVRKGIGGVLSVSAVGIFFAGYFTLREIPKLLNEGLNAYVLGLPTCALGLIFYVLIFVLSLWLFLNLNKKRK